jgi:hypothetical protein
MSPLSLDVLPAGEVVLGLCGGPLHSHKPTPLMSSLLWLLDIKDSSVTSLATNIKHQTASTSHLNLTGNRDIQLSLHFRDSNIYELWVSPDTLRPALSQPSTTRPCLPAASPQSHDALFAMASSLLSLLGKIQRTRTPRRRYSAHPFYLVLLTLIALAIVSLPVAFLNRNNDSFDHTTLTRRGNLLAREESATLEVRLFDLGLVSWYILTGLDLLIHNAMVVVSICPSRKGSMRLHQRELR